MAGDAQRQWIEALLERRAEVVLRALSSLAIVQVPLAWLAAHALRHVDTPHTHYFATAAICGYAVTPLLVADELLGVAAYLLHPPPER